MLKNFQKNFPNQTIISKTCVAILISASSPFAFAQVAVNPDSSNENDKVYGANLMVTVRQKVGANVKVIDSNEIKAMQVSSVDQVLSKVSGVHINKSSFNSISSVMIRGAKSSQTLVLIDGVAVNDPMSPERSFDFSKLKTTNIDRIEVLKGSQSTLYGSNAMGGVVQIFTKKGSKPLTSVDLEMGSFHTFESTLSHSGSNDRWQYSFSASADTTDGISAAGKEYNNIEKDGKQNRTFSTNIGFNAASNLRFDATLRYINDKLDYDAHGGYLGDDYYLRQKSQHLVGKLSSTLYTFDDRLISLLSYEISDIKRKNSNDPDSLKPDFERSKFNGKQQTVMLKNTFNFYPKFASVLGLSHTQETGDSSYYSDGKYGPYSSKFDKKSLDSSAIFLDQTLNIGENWFNTLGLRVDDFETYGTKATYRWTSRFQISPAWSLKGSIGTGFKTPTLYQLYAPNFGNINLSPEKSTTYDIGVIWEQSNRSTFETSLFWNDYKDLIDFKNQKYYNVSHARSKGLEVNWDYQLSDTLKTSLAYYYLWAKDLDAQKVLPNRPRHTVSLALDYQATEKLSFHTDYSYYSTAKESVYDDKTFKLKTVDIKSYGLLNISGRYQLNDKVEFRAKINNVLNKSYETSYGYGQAKINGSIGVKIDF